ncbi:MAG TPA: hypothetical protein VEK76_07265 [Candidatus Binatia bacterium]|nr:hypothetical protein [Candidatus Binatia bacterium]
MSIGDWVVACLWLAGLVTALMLALFIIALADPSRRRGTRAGNGSHGH